MVEFDGISINLEGHELRRDGVVVKVEPQVFDVLAYLIVHRDRMVPKSELLDAVWGHRFVTESALTSRIKTARALLGDTGREQRIIRTVHGKGYRFVANLGDGEADAADQRDIPALLEALSHGHGAALRVDLGAGGGPWLRELRERATAHGFATGHGSTHRSSLRTYGCLIDAIDDVISRQPELLDALPGPCRAEIEQVLSGLMPTHRQRFVLAVHELIVGCSRRRSGLVLVLDGLEHADDDTVAAVGHFADLARYHAVVLAVGVRGDLPAVERFDLVTTPVDADPVPADPVPTRGALAADAVEALELVALLEPPFDLATMSAVLAQPTEVCLRLLDLCAVRNAVHSNAGRYSLDLPRLGLEANTLPHRHAGEHRVVAERLIAADGDPVRVAYHLVEAGDGRRALPYVVRVARTRADAGLYREALAWIDRVLSEAGGAELGELHALRADAFGALGDPAAIAAYRQALGYADASRVPRLRARLARAVLWSGDIATACDLLAGLEPDGGPGDADLLLVLGMLAYFQGDLAAAEQAADAARELALAPGASTNLLDAITLQGMIAHSRGEWSDRLVRELRLARSLPEVATTVFDCHLCVAEYLLYGPTPYVDVVEMATRLYQEAHTLGAPRGMAFASCVAGEALLLSGDLDGAAAELKRSVELHQTLGGDTGLAHSLQRLAETHLAQGRRADAERLARDAAARARWSPLSHHLLQRVYGTLVSAAPDRTGALAVVDEATQVLDESQSCHFCEVMFAVPAAIACARGGRLDDAERYAAAAERSAMLWQGTAWQGAVTEARAAICAARGDWELADTRLLDAAAAFEQAGQPLDAARCRQALSFGVAR